MYIPTYGARSPTIDRIVAALDEDPFPVACVAERVVFNT
jgi:hypothetical protein